MLNALVLAGATGPATNHQINWWGVGALVALGLLLGVTSTVAEERAGNDNWGIKGLAAKFLVVVAVIFAASKAGGFYVEKPAPTPSLQEVCGTYQALAPDKYDACVHGFEGAHSRG